VWCFFRERRRREDRERALFFFLFFFQFASFLILFIYILVRSQTREGRALKLLPEEKKSVPTSKGRVVLQFATVSAADLAVE